MGNKESTSPGRGEPGTNPLGIKFNGAYTCDAEDYSYSLKFDPNCSVAATVNGK